MTARERGVAAATVFNAGNPGQFPGRPLFEGLVENAIREALFTERIRIAAILRGDVPRMAETFFANTPAACVIGVPDLERLAAQLEELSNADVP